MTEENETSWSEMIPDLLETISDRLSLQDYLVFCCVCRHWRFAPSYRSNLIYFHQNRPWLMFYGVDSTDRDKCYLYSLSHTESCQVRVPHLRGATCVDSKSGWLLARRNRHLFFCNPFSGTKIDLPEYPHEAEAAECVGTFSFLPTSPDCKIFVLSRKNDLIIEIGTCLVGDEKWDIQDLEVSETELDTMTFAIYCCNVNTCDAGKDCICSVDACGGDHCVYVRGSKMGMTYTVADKSYGVWERKPPKVIHAYYRELEALHYANWLEKFGENGISISTCSLVLASYDTPGYFAREIQIDGKTTTERRRVKAAGVEPMFKRC